MKAVEKVITPKSLKLRAQKIWQRGDIHRAWLQKTDYFPLEIPLKSISANDLLTNFTEVHDAINDLRHDSNKQGYLICDKSIAHRQLGEQKIPSVIIFEIEAVFLNYISKSAELIKFKTLTQQTLQQDTLLLDWIIRYPFKVMKYADVWSKLLNVCLHFERFPKPGCYIRQLDIKGVDTKFIEQHKGILSELLSQTLAEKNYHQDITGLNNHGFERRYGLRYDQPQIRLRILDAKLAVQGLTDLTLTIDEFKQLNINTKTIFIAENKINGLAFPDFPQSIVIFGLGYAVNLLADAQCFNNTKIFYWGDIDTHGFAILSRLRHYYPLVKSLLMDKKTLEKHANLCVKEDKDKSEQKAQHNLTDCENELYLQLQKNLIRLEQERISYDYLQSHLKRL